MHTADTPAPETWDFWDDSAHEPALNMAFDEALLATAAARERPLLRFYEWDRPAVTIGYVQRFDAAPTGFAVVRRPTGGGIVYHDVDFTYSVIIPPEHWLSGLDRTHSYRWINRAVQAGLHRCRMTAALADAEIAGTVDRLTMICFANPTRYDILMDGRKVAGSAQRRTRQGILHQGSLHFGGPLPMDRDILGRALTEGFRTTLHLTLQPFTADADLCRLAETMRTEKYAKPAWNRRR